MSRKEKEKEFTQYSYQHRCNIFDYSLASLDFQCPIRKHDYGVAYQPISG